VTNKKARDEAATSREPDHPNPVRRMKMADCPSTLDRPVPATDNGLIDAWEVRQRAIATIQANGGYYDAETHSPVEAYAADAADNKIERSLANTLKGLRAKLWVALAYVGECRTEESHRERALVLRADMDTLWTNYAELDFEKQLLVSAIRSVDQMMEVSRG
jgi:hypothetical protein